MDADTLDGWRRLFGREPLMSIREEREGSVYATVGNMALRISFEPVVDLVDSLTFGYVVKSSASRTGWQVDLVDLLPISADGRSILRLDRVAAALAAINFKRRGLTGTLLLNIDSEVPGHLTSVHAESLSRALRLGDLSPEVALIELSEANLADPMRAAHIWHCYRSHGFRIALSGLTVEHGALRRAIRAPVHLVKLGAQTLRNARRSVTLRRHLQRLVPAIGHLAGLHVAVEGVESAELAELAREIGAKYAQGSYYGQGYRTDTHEWSPAWVA